MIPWIICLIFGHKRYTDYYTGKTDIISSPLVGPKIVPVVITKPNTICPRCGAKL